MNVLLPVRKAHPCVCLWAEFFFLRGTSLCELDDCVFCELEGFLLANGEVGARDAFAIA